MYSNTEPGQIKPKKTFFCHTNEHIHSSLMAIRWEAHHLAAVTDMQALEKGSSFSPI